MRSTHLRKVWQRAVAGAVLGSLAAGVGGRALHAQGPDQQLGPAVPPVVADAALPVNQAKDPGTATILSIVIIGAGQIYAGDINRGLLMLGGAYGAVIAGAILSSSASCSFITGTCSDGSYAPLAIGALAAVGIWVWGIADAAPTTRRMNASRGIAAQADRATYVRHAAGRMNLGLRVRY